MCISPLARHSCERREVCYWTRSAIVCKGGRSGIINQRRFNAMTVYNFACATWGCSDEKAVWQVGTRTHLTVTENAIYFPSSGIFLIFSICSVYLVHGSFFGAWDCLFCDQLHVHPAHIQQVCILSRSIIVKPINPRPLTALVLPLLPYDPPVSFPPLFSPLISLWYHLPIQTLLSKPRNASPSV